MPFALPGYALSGLLFATLRRRAPADRRRWLSGAMALAAAGTALHVVLTAPAYLGGHAEGAPALIVMTLNTRVGDADAGQAAAIAAEHGAQILVLQEVTPVELRQFEDVGISDLLPYRAGGAGPAPAGTVVYSAFPLEAVEPLPVAAGALRVRVRASESFTLIAVHASQPLEARPEWSKDLRALNRVAAETEGPALMVGDFNATLDHGPMRELMERGLTDAARRSNAGWQPTWPSLAGSYGGIPNLLAFLTIDHVLFTAEFDAVTTKTVPVRFSDHKALLAGLAWRG